MKSLTILMFSIFIIYSCVDGNTKRESSSNDDVTARVMVWQFDTGGCISSSPAVNEDMVFVGACNGLFFGIDRHTGIVKWQYDIRNDADQTGFHGRYLLTDDLVVVATDGVEEGFVYAFEQISGKVRWKHQMGGPVPSNVIRNSDLIYVVTQADTLVALELANGMRRWSFAPVEGPHFDNLTSSIVILNDLVVMSGRDGTVYALNADNGQVKWHYQIGDEMTSPIGTHELIYVGSINENKIMGLSPTNGSQIAEAKFTESLISYMPPIITSTGLAIASGNTLVLWTNKLNKYKWQVTATSSFTRSPIEWNHLIVLGTVDGQVLGFNSVDGGKNLTFQVNGIVTGIGSYNDTLYVGTQEGILYAVRP